VNLSQKCQYALRAVFELARRYQDGPVSVSQIAAAQAIPPRFLELILKQLRQAGWVQSHRGVHGGYELAVSPYALTVGQVIRFIEGPLSPVRCLSDVDADTCPLRGNCAFEQLWRRAEQAVSAVYDTTSFQDLLERQAAAAGRYVANYCI